MCSEPPRFAPNPTAAGPRRKWRRKRPICVWFLRLPSAIDRSLVLRRLVGWIRRRVGRVNNWTGVGGVRSRHGVAAFSAPQKKRPRNRGLSFRSNDPSRKAGRRPSPAVLRENPRNPRRSPTRRRPSPRRLREHDSVQRSHHRNHHPRPQPCRRPASAARGR